MLCDFSISVLDHEGKEILDPERKSPLPLLHWVKQIAGTQLEGDPTNVEHYRKMFKVYAKLEKAIDGKVELKTDTVVWLRERFVKAKIFPPVVFAFERATEKPITDEELDGV